MNAFVDFVLRRPGLVLGLWFLLALASLPGLLRLELRTDGHALVPAQAPEVLVDAAVRERFDVRDPIVLVLHAAGPAGIFETALLRRVGELTDAVREKLQIEPEHLTSLATEYGFRVRPGTLQFRRLLEPLPETPPEFELLRDDLERIGLYRGILVADDGRAAAIVVGTPPGINRVDFYHRLVELTRNPPFAADRIDVLGAPVAEALLGHHLLADLGVPQALLGPTTDPAPSWHLGMVPVALAVIALLLYAALRDFKMVCTTLALIGLCLLLVFGLMGWLRQPVYLTTAVMPVILTAIGVADAIHLLLRFQQQRRVSQAQSTPQLLRETFAELNGPVVQTSVTTALGFCSFMISELGPVRSFGFFTGLGVLLLMVGALSFLPACLCFIPTSGGLRTPQSERLGAAFAALSRAIAKHRRAVLAAAALLVLLAGDGVRRVEVHDSWLDGFSPRSAFAQATRNFEEHFLGSHQLLVAVEIDSWRSAGKLSATALDHHTVSLPSEIEVPADPERLVGGWIRVASPQREWSASVESVTRTPDFLLLTLPLKAGSPKFWLRPAADASIDFELWTEPFLMPMHLQRIDALETFLADQPGVGGVLGPVRYLRTTGFMMHPENPEARRLPENPEEARRRWHNYGVVRGEERLRQTLTREADQGLIAAYLQQSDFRATGRLMRALRAYEETHLRPQGIRLHFAGDVAVSQALIESVVRTQVGSLVLSLVGIFLAAAVLGRSWRWGWLCVLPAALAVWLNFAVMGWLGIPLGVATAMFAGMTLGVGVDSAIHVLARRRLALRSGMEPAQALHDAMHATGPAVSLNAIAVGLGFGVLVLSQVPGNARLGFLLLLSTLICWLATLLLLPAWLSRPAKN